MDSSRFCNLIDNLTINPPSDSKPWYSKLFGWHPLFSAVDVDSLASPAAIVGISDGDEKQEIDVLTCPGVRSVDFFEYLPICLRTMCENAAFFECSPIDAHKCACISGAKKIASMLCTIDLGQLHSRKWTNATPASLHIGVLCTQSG